MRRRDVVQLLAGAVMAAPYRAAAQTTAKIYQVATFTSGPAIPANSPIGTLLTRALAEHGYKLGQNLEIQAYGADAQLARLPQAARDIAASKFDAVVVTRLAARRRHEGHRRSYGRRRWRGRSGGYWPRR